MKRTKMVINEKPIADFAAYLAEESMVTHTRSRYCHDVKLFTEYLGGRSITQKNLNEFKAVLSEKYSPATAKTMLLGVNRYLKFIRTSVRADVTGPIIKHVKEPEEQLTAEAVEAGKTSYFAAEVFGGAFAVYLRKAPTGLLLINGLTNRVCGVSEAEDKLKKVAVKCGVSDLSFAALRDTLGARCAENGLKPKLLAEIMGGDVRVYFPEPCVSESPLEFLSGAY